MDISTRLRTSRKNKNLSMKELSELSKVAQGTISDIENKKILNPRADTISKLANVLGVSTSYLMHGEDTSQIDKITNREIDLIKKYDGMEDFTDAHKAIAFLLEQPAIMAYGGYDLRKMSDEDILEMANDMLFTISLSIEKRKRKMKK